MDIFKSYTRILYRAENFRIHEDNKQYLIWRLRKRVDQALIPISTILKFPAQTKLSRKPLWI